MTYRIESRSELGDRRPGIDQLLSRTADADGIEPFDEQARLNVAKSAGSRYVLAYAEDDGDGPRVVGIAAIDLRTRSVELTVDPDFRGLGIGSGLLQGVLDETRGAGRFTIWAHGSSVGSEVLAKRFGLDKVRELLVMSRDLVTLDGGAKVDTGAWEIEPFDETRDLEPLIALNSSAFADHPEQGKLTEDDFRERFAQSWFDPSLLWLVRGAEGPVAFLWLKPHTQHRVELYVLGVDPSAQGMGLGGMLSAFMLDEMVDRGFTEAILYVEADNEPAVRAYRRVGFDVFERHVAYNLPTSDDS